jgi:hypothetical protein
MTAGASIRRRGRIGQLYCPNNPISLCLTREQLKIRTSDKAFDPLTHTIGLAAVFAVPFDQKTPHVFGFARRLAARRQQTAAHGYEADARSCDGGVRKELAKRLSSGNWPSDREKLRCGFFGSSHLLQVRSHLEPMLLVK